jgi:hypothetical protein
VLGVRRLPASLMPSFAQGLKPADVADLLGWLRSHLGKGVPKQAKNQKVSGGDSSSPAGDTESVLVSLRWSEFRSYIRALRFPARVRPCARAFFSRRSGEMQGRVAPYRSLPD